MPRASLVRRVVFAAAHRYARPDWDEARNQEVFGACARPNFHGHNYVCWVMVTGEVDPETGMVVPLETLDRVLAREVMDRFDHRNINLEVAEFGAGRLIPTTENLARFILDRVQDGLGREVRVTEVRLHEDESLGAVVRGEA
jgi:6-pyruvoyltetrahydropterin/6-carboxytetrahydropterin synthase